MLLMWFSALILLGRIAVITGQERIPVKFVRTCSGDELSIACEEDSLVIQVLAVYAVEGYRRGCAAPFSSSCAIEIKDGNLYNAIMSMCHQEHECSYIFVPPYHNGRCHEYSFYYGSDYALVKYRCTHRNDQSTVFVPRTDESTIEPSTTNQTVILHTTVEVTSTISDAGLIVGVTLGMILLAVIIILVALFVLRRRRKAPSRTSTPAAYQNQLYDGSVANNNDIVTSPVGDQAKNSEPGPVSIKSSTDHSDYSLATVVDEYAKVDKDRPRKKFDDYSLARDTEIEHDVPSHGDYSLATGEQLGNATGGTGYPGSYGNTDRNPQYRTKEHGMIDGPQQQLTARRDLDDNDLVVEDNANYESGQFPARGPIHGNPDTLLSHNDDLVITDNAQYETGQFQDRDPRDEVGNEDVGHSDLVMVDNANYEKNNFSMKSGNQPADRKVDISVTGGTFDHSEEADDTDVTIIDNEDYVGYEGV